MQESKEINNDLKPVKKAGHSLLIYCLVFFAILLAVICGFVFFITQTQKGQAWLAATANNFLKSSSNSVYFQIADISGSMPFNFHIALKGYDTKGEWLNAPANAIDINWKILANELRITNFELRDIDFSRFPKLPESQDQNTSQSQAFGIEDFQKILVQTNEFLAKKIWWLPEIRIENAKIANALLPVKIIPQTKNKRLVFNLNLDGSCINNSANLNLQASVQNAGGGTVDLDACSFSSLNISVALNEKQAAQGFIAKAALKAQLAKPELKSMPQEFLGENAELELNLETGLTQINNIPELSVMLNGPNLAAGNINLKSEGKWTTGEKWKTGLMDGLLKINIAGSIDPPAQKNGQPADMLEKPLNFLLSAAGNFPELSAKLSLDCQQIKYEKLNINDIYLNIASEKIDLPLQQNSLENENTARLNFSASSGGEKLNLEGDIFFQPLKEKIWRAGARTLLINAPGISLSGNLAALFFPKKIPLLDGSIKIDASNLKLLSKLMPEQILKGGGLINLSFESGAINNPALPYEKANMPEYTEEKQQANIELKIPNFSWHSQNSKGIIIHDCDLSAQIQKLFAKPNLKAELIIAKINAAGINTAIKLKTHGSPNDNLFADFSAFGDFAAEIKAQWQKERIKLNKLDLKINAAKLVAARKKALSAGLRLEKPAEIFYGEQKLNIGEVKIKILPSGYLFAKGIIAEEKLDLNFAIQKLDFTPLQNLFAEMPAGSASFTANLKGSRYKPAGKLLLELDGIKLPNILPMPVNATLFGNIENKNAKSILNTKLSINPGTLKSLGCDSFAFNAQIPLNYDANGIPKPAADEKLQAKIVWAGAIGPVWNLLPLPDQRLNGRINLAIDASGSIAKPDISGGIKIEKGRYENILYGILLTDINLQANLAKQRTNGGYNLPGMADIILNLSDGRGGNVNVSGTAGLDGKNLDITAKINRLKPLRRRDVHIEFSGNINTKGNAASPDIAGELKIEKGEILLDNIDFGPGNVTTLTITKPEKQKPVQKTAAAGGKLDVRVIMHPRFAVDGRGLGSIWQANLLIAGTLANPQILGNINAVQGNFDFLGKNFILNKGIVTFAGGSPSNPLLEIELTNTTPDLTASILLAGPANKMKLELKSDPALPRDDILSRVLFGRSVNDLSQFEALQLAAAVAQLAGFGGKGGGVLNFAKKTLGVDVLKVGTASGNANDGSNTGTTVEMGKYISDNIYMGVQQGMKPDSSTFIIQLELTPRTNLELKSENNNTWGGIRWKYNY